MADFLSVQTNIQSGGALASDIGRTLLLQTAAAPTEFTDAVAIRRALGATEYNSTTDVPSGGLNDGATVYFGQDPYPRALLIASRFSTAHHHIAIGTTPKPVTDITALGENAGDRLLINGNAMPAASGDFNTVADYGGSTDANDADHALETLINASDGFSGVAVIFDSANNVFIITSPNSFGAGFSGDVAEAYGLTGAQIFPAVPANESYSAALTRISNAGAEFGWVVPHTNIVNAGGSADALRAMAGWVNSRNKMMIFDSFGAGPLVSDESASDVSVISALKQKRVGAIYNGPVIDYKALGYTAFFSAVNYRGAGTVVSGAHKQIQGTTANSLTPAAKTELQRKRVNYYEADGALTFTRTGWSFGTWIDAQAFANWFNDAVITEIVNTLQSSEVGQVDTDVSLVEAVNTICGLGVINGAIAPGALDAEAVGNIRNVVGNPSFPADLPAGYYVHQGSYADQSRSDRNARKATPINVWMTGRGFVNEVDLVATFQP